MDDATLAAVREDPDRVQAARRVAAEHAGWYHTLDLAAGVTTRGFCDLRPLLPHALPPDLRGRRCLDVGTFDGMYAFAMEERGAAEVVGIDVPDPADLDHPPLTRESNLAIVRETGIWPGDGFRAAAAARRSRARWVGCNVYDLDADAVGGPVDFAVVSTILQHLRNPVGALERVRDTLVPGGTAVVVEAFVPRLTRLHPREPVLQFRAGSTSSNYTWQVPNLAGLRAWVTAAGLDILPGRPFRYRLRGPNAIGRGTSLAVLRVRRPAAVSVPAQPVAGRSQPVSR